MRPRLIRGRIFRLSLAAVAIASLAAGVATASQGSEPPHAQPVHAPREVTSKSTRPNIVFVLTDDLSMNLLRYMPHVEAMERTGLTFNNYFVSDSLCCPSRSSIFTGNFPHDTRVFNNTGRHGGFDQFYSSRRGAAHVRGGAAERRLPDRADGQVPERLRAAARQRPRAAVHLRASGLERVGRRGLGLSRVQLQPQRGRGASPLRQPAVGLPD